MKEKKETKPDGSWPAFSLAWELGYTIAVPLLVFALAGRFLDKKLETTPLMLLLGLLISIALTSWLVYKKTKEILNQ